MAKQSETKYHLILYHRTEDINAKKYKTYAGRVERFFSSK